MTIEPIDTDPNGQDAALQPDPALQAWLEHGAQAREDALMQVWRRTTPDRQAALLVLLEASQRSRDGVVAAGVPATLEDHMRTVEGIAHRCLSMGQYFNAVSSHPAQGAEFWIHAQNALGEALCQLWCHLFGSRGDDYHYARLFGRAEIAALPNAPYFRPAAVRSRLIVAAGETDASFTELWRMMKRCRDKYIAHREEPVPSVVFPDVDRALAIVAALRDEYAGVIRALQASGRGDPWLQELRAFYDWAPNKAVARRCKDAFTTGLSHAGRWLEQISSTTAASVHRLHDA